MLISLTANPQGSCLGPLLFLAYINDISAYIPEKALNLYADDTAILAVGNDRDSLCSELQMYSHGLEDWCQHNKLVINTTKSKIMYFSPNMKLSIESLEVKLNNLPLEEVQSYKYLGFILDNQLNCRNMLNDTISKLNYTLRIFRRTRSSLTLKASIAVLKSKFLSYIDYICLFTYLLSKNDYKKIQTMQNCAIRCTFQLSKRTNVDSYHCKIKTLHVDNRRYLLLMIYMYKLTLDPDFCPNPGHSFNTRTSAKLNFNLARPVHSKFNKSHCYVGRKLWNDLSADDQNLPDVDSFKRRLKRRLLETELALYGLPG